VLADGTVLSSLNRMIKNNAGYDLKHLFIGSEGTLGIVTRVVLRLRPKPKSHNAALVACERFEQVASLLQAVDGGFSGMLSAFEVMWEPFYKLVTSEPARNRPPLAYGHPYYVLIEALGSSQERDSERFETVLDEAMAAGFITDAVLARSRAERDKLWAMRDDVEQMGRLAPIFTYDISLPIPTMPGYVDEVRAGLEAKWKDPACVVFGHLGDGNLHVNVVGPAADDEAVDDAVLRLVADHGGSISAEHGIGRAKQRWLHLSRSPEELRVFRAIKSALDPTNTLNAGAGPVPT
jgi:FAD/FMN-containing dehydrogenase